MHYLKLVMGLAVLGSLNTGCQKESILSMYPSSSQDLATSGGGPSRLKPGKEVNRKKLEGSDNQKGKTISSTRGTPACIREKRANRKILGNSRDHLIFDAKGNLIKAKLNAKHDKQGSGIVFSPLYGIVRYERMRKLPDGWYEPKPGVSWGTGIADINEMDSAESQSDQSQDEGFIDDIEGYKSGSKGGTIYTQDMDVN